MKKLINNVDDVLSESLRGFEAACGDVVRLHRDPVFLSRVAPAPEGKVALDDPVSKFVWRAKGPPRSRPPRQSARWRLQS